MSLLSSLIRAILGRPADAELTAARFKPTDGGSRSPPYGPGRPSAHPPPAAKGEYRWIDAKTRKAGYIGITSNLRRRKREHERSRPELSTTHRFVWKTAHPNATRHDLKQHEKKKIKQKKPPLNKRAGGGGRNAKK